MLESCSDRKPANHPVPHGLSAWLFFSFRMQRSAWSETILHGASLPCIVHMHMRIHVHTHSEFYSSSQPRLRENHGTLGIGSEDLPCHVMSFLSPSRVCRRSTLLYTQTARIGTSQLSCPVLTKLYSAIIMLTLCIVVSAMTFRPTLI